jgi:hypothetical protein
MMLVTTGLNFQGHSGAAAENEMPAVCGTPCTPYLCSKPNMGD